MLTTGSRIQAEKTDKSFDDMYLKKEKLPSGSLSFYSTDSMILSQLYSVKHTFPGFSSSFGSNAFLIRNIRSTWSSPIHCFR